MSKVDETMKCLKTKAIEALEAYSTKDAWKQDDLTGAKDAVKLYNEICDAQMKDGIWENMKTDWGTSGYQTPHGYTRISYGQEYDNMSNRMSHNAMYHDPRYADNYSEAYRDGYRGHSGMMDRHSMGYDDRVSTHSIKDRMIAALEKQMDEAKSEYEREEVRKAIMDIENMKR